MATSTIVTVEDVEKLIDEVYIFRDEYHYSHVPGFEGERNAIVEKKVFEILDMIENIKGKDDKELEEQIVILKAKAYNLNSYYNCDCGEMLKRYLLRHPNYRCFNFLAENYWKNNDFELAVDCFEASLRFEKNVEAYQSLSMLMRQAANIDTEERLRKSISYGHEAVNMDVSNGKSWYILGNAYLALYFKSPPNIKTLKQCLSCYANAGRSEKMKKDPYFHYGRALAMMYDENFSEALKGFEECAEILPSWEEPKNYIESIKKFLEAVPTYLEHKGKLKARRMSQILKKYDMKNLGPFVDSTVFKDEDLSEGKRLFTQLTDLKDGTNKNRIIMGIIVGQVFCAEPVSATFCMIDDQKNSIAVNMYNLAEGKGMKIGDVVVITEPNVKRVSGTYDSKTFNFKWIRVDQPDVLCVNGKMVPLDWVGLPLMTSTFAVD